MKTFNRICAQGDVLIMRVADLPNREMTEVAPEGNHVIVTHSETGHHHVLERDSATMFECKDDALEAFLVVHRDAELKHLRPYDTHDSIKLTPGTYKVRRAREYTPEGYRRVAD